MAMFGGGGVDRIWSRGVIGNSAPLQPMVPASQLANLRGPFCPHEWLLGLGLGSYWAPTPDWLPRFLIQIPRPQVSSLVIY